MFTMFFVATVCVIVFVGLCVEENARSAKERMFEAQRQERRADAREERLAVRRERRQSRAQRHRPNPVRSRRPRPWAPTAEAAPAREAQKTNSPAGPDLYFGC